MGTRRKFMRSVAAASTIGAVGIAGCLGDDGETTEIQAATVFNEDHIQSRILERGVENFIEASDNEYELDLLAGQIGGEEDQMESAATGDIEMHSTSFGGLTNRYASEYGFVSAPFIAEDWEHLQAIEEEFVHGEEDSLNAELIDGGDQRVLGGAYRGIRHTTANEAFTHPDDMENVPMRLPEIDSWIQPWDEIGVDVTPVQADELYSAMETGVVEASEGPIGQFVDFSLYEVQSHFVKTGHMTQAYAQVVNESFWQDLSDDDQENLRNGVEDAIEWGYEELQSDFADLEEMVVEEHDTTIVEEDEVDQEAFQEAAQPAVDRLFEEEWLAEPDDVFDLA